MFTSRAENRLTLRADNADARLTAEGVRVGVVGTAREVAFLRKMERLGQARDVVQGRSVSRSELASLGIAVARDGGRRSAYAVLGLAGIEASRVSEVLGLGLEGWCLEQLAREATYAAFGDRQSREAAMVAGSGRDALDPALDYGAVSGLSSELAGKLARLRPRNVAEASRIEGMTPAALLTVLSAQRRFRVVR